MPRFWWVLAGASAQRTTGHGQRLSPCFCPTVSDFSFALGSEKAQVFQPSGFLSSLARKLFEIRYLIFPLGVLLHLSVKWVYKDSLSGSWNGTG